MDSIIHLFKKDLIRLKYLFFVWLFLILVQSALGIGGHKIAAQEFAFQMICFLKINLIQEL